MQILVHHHGTDRYAIRGTETTVLHIDGKAILGLSIGAKPIKTEWSLPRFCAVPVFPQTSTPGRMAPAMRQVALPVLPSTAARHAFHHHFIIFAVDGGITGIAIDAVQFIVFYLLHDVRSNEMPPIGQWWHPDWLSATGWRESLPARWRY